MISRINRIWNVGKFEDFDTPVELGKLTLIYAENGRGKSTLADIFRSIRKGEQDRVLGRQTQGSDSPPELELELSDRTSLSYNTNRWHSPCDDVFVSDDIFVFDDVFINANVYSGNSVDTPNRRSLATLIIGDTAVRFQEQEDALVESKTRREKNQSKLENQIRDRIYHYRDDPSDKPSVIEFVALAEDKAVDFRLDQQTFLVRQLLNKDRIQQEEEFTTVDPLELPVKSLEHLLQASWDGIEETAASQVQRHLDTYGIQHMEDWLETGTNLHSARPDVCPFCGEKPSRQHLIQHYQAFFRKEYKDLKAKITDFPKLNLKFETYTAALNRTIQKNSDLLKTWQAEFEELEIDSLSYDEIVDYLNSATDLMKEQIETKRNAPLEKMMIDSGLKFAIGEWDRNKEQIDTYNSRLTVANVRIASLKEQLISGNLEEEERKKQLLQNTGCRYKPDVVSLCDEYCEETEQIEREKNEVKLVRRAKDQAIADLFASYKDNINRYLGPKYFDVEFSLCEFDFTRDTAGERVNAYAIKFPAGVIPVGKADAFPAESSFKNALSAGDRSTLSFAVYLAHLDSLAELNRKVIVIDDPITSMDANRQWATYEAIRDFCGRDAQVIVLSHSAEFLHTVWDEYGRRRDQGKSTKRLWIRPKEGTVHTSNIEPEWDSESFLMNRHRKRIQKVEEFIGGVQHDPEEVGKCLRQIVEHHYKDLYPMQYTNKLKSLGSFLGCVEKAESGDTLKALKDSKLDELRKTNGFLRGLHHADDAPFPSETELRSRCRKVLAHIRSN